MTKQELRKTFLAQRRALTQAELALRSKLICENFFTAADLSNIHVIHIFLPIAKQNEPNTWQIIERLKSEYSHIRICAPKVDEQSNMLQHFYLNEDAKLRHSEWGIPEPTEGKEVDASDIDMVLVPLLTFDQSGNRVGYGKGFYDKFLSQCRDTTQRVGISLFNGVESIDDINAYDEPLHFCITPYEVVSF